MIILTKQVVWAILFDALHAEFVRDGNPLHAWKAYKWSRAWSHPLPDWAAAYFDDVSAALLKGTPPTTALRFATKGGHSKWRQLADDHRNVEIYSVIDGLMKTKLDSSMQTKRGDLRREFRDLKWLFKKPLRGESKLDRICERVAADMRRPNAVTLDGRKERPLSAKTLHDIYFARNSPRKKTAPTTR